MPPAKKTTGNGAATTATEVETLRHPADVTRRNIPTAETSSLMAEEEARARPMLDGDRSPAGAKASQPA